MGTGVVARDVIATIKSQNPPFFGSLVIFKETFNRIEISAVFFEYSRIIK